MNIINNDSMFYYITNVIIPNNDAQSQQIFSMGQALHKVLGTKFALISPLSPKSKSTENNFQWIRPRLPLQPRLIRYLSLALISLPKLISRHTNAVLTRDVGIALISVFCGKKTLFEIHQSPSSRFSLLLLKTYLTNQHSTIIAISDALKTYLVNQLNVNSEKILVLHDAADVDEILEIRKKGKELLRAELNIPQSAFVVVHTGSVDPSRGFENLFPLLNSTLNFLFIQVGGKPNDIENLKQKFHGNSKIKFIPPSEKKVVYSYQAAADLAVYLVTKKLRWWWCTSPLKIFEYMAAGTPILSPSIGSVLEVLNKDNAVLYNPDVPDSLINVFKEILEHPSILPPLAKVASEESINKYSWVKRCEQIAVHVGWNSEQKAFQCVE